MCVCLVCHSSHKNPGGRVMGQALGDVYIFGISVIPYNNPMNLKFIILQMQRLSLGGDEDLRDSQEQN